jgi:hypothetical protein
LFGILPIGVFVFLGTDIPDTRADKARKFAIPV